MAAAWAAVWGSGCSSRSVVAPRSRSDSRDPVFCLGTDSAPGPSGACVPRPPRSWVWGWPSGAGMAFKRLPRGWFGFVRDEPGLFRRALDPCGSWLMRVRVRLVRGVWRGREADSRGAVRVSPSGHRHGTAPPGRPPGRAAHRTGPRVRCARAARRARSRPLPGATGPGAGVRLRDLRHRVGQPVEHRARLFVADRERWKQAHHAGVPSAEFHDQPAAQALPLDGGRQFGGRRRRSARGTTAASRGPRVRRRSSAPGRARRRHSRSRRQGPGVGRSCGFPEPRLARRGRSRGRSARVAAPAAMASWLPRNVPAWAPGSQTSRSVAVDDDRQRQAAADGLGEDHHVGCDAAVLHRPEGAGPADSRLDLVGDQRDGARRGDLPHPPHPVVAGRNHSALALHRFQDHPGGARHPGLGVVEDGLGPARGEFGTAVRRRRRTDSGSPADRAGARHVRRTRPRMPRAPPRSSRGRRRRRRESRCARSRRAPVSAAASTASVPAGPQNCTRAGRRARAAACGTARW